jgi:hypothetical protein
MVKTLFNGIITDILDGIDSLISETIVMPEDLQVMAYEWMVTNMGAEIEPRVMSEAAKQDLVQVFQFLQARGRSATFENVKLATSCGNINFLRAVHKIDPALVCTVETANKAMDAPWIETYTILDFIYQSCGLLPDLQFPRDYRHPNKTWEEHFGEEFVKWYRDKNPNTPK